MNILAVVSQKGGCGKSTLTIHVGACAAELNIKTMIIDLDEQKTVSDWYQAKVVKNPNLKVTDCKAVHLHKKLKEAKEKGFHFIIIDTAPHTHSDSVTAAKLADFVIIPCRPSRPDLKAITNTVEIMKRNNIAYSIILNACGSGKRPKQVIEILRKEGFIVFDQVIMNRVAFDHALDDGKSVFEYQSEGKAAEEIRNFFKLLTAA